MSLKVDLPNDVVCRLQAEARRRGLTIEGLIADLASDLPPAQTGPGRRPAFVAVGMSETGLTDRIDEALAEGFGHD